MSTNKIDYWLEEKELKTPEHDKMVLWAFDNIKEIVNKLGILSMIEMNETLYKEGGYNDYFDITLWHNDIKEYVSEDKQKNKEVKDIYNKFKLLKDVSWKIINKTIEYKLPDNYNHGFIDLAIFLSRNTEENMIKGSNFCFSLNSRYDSIKLYLEIKPEVKSIGETMRQINYYRRYLKNEYSEKSFFILITKTKNIQEIFKTQDVFVYEYEEENNEEEPEDELLNPMDLK